MTSSPLQSEITLSHRPLATYTITENLADFESARSSGEESRIARRLKRIGYYSPYLIFNTLWRDCGQEVHYKTENTMSIIR